MLACGGPDDARSTRSPHAVCQCSSENNAVAERASRIMSGWGERRRHVILNSLLRQRIHRVSERDRASERPLRDRPGCSEVVLLPHRSDVRHKQS